jgi:Rrf2 family protein
MTFIITSHDFYYARKQNKIHYFCTMFSKTFGYALRALVFVHIHGSDEVKVGLEQISKELNIPHHFLGKIMQGLVRQGILDSVKGPNGGFYTNAQTAGTSLLDLLIIVDGNLILDQCALGIKSCNAAHPCPLHDDFAVCRNGMLEAMSSKTLGTLAEEVNLGNSFLTR